jgi:hypothetical protein
VSNDLQMDNREQLVEKLSNFFAELLAKNLDKNSSLKMINGLIFEFESSRGFSTNGDLQSKLRAIKMALTNIGERDFCNEAIKLNHHFDSVLKAAAHRDYFGITRGKN